ncbi:MAG: flagellar basal body-associated FliL family protein [Kangiellaceae bacterium]|nr:flagellar basal body-associated FliL family protein [Kangiellaceae bacterium]MCW9000934.1 flagellar basal body-associated FliL family protein [Kangiellaceae bacterium]
MLKHFFTWILLALSLSHTPVYAAEEAPEETEEEKKEEEKLPIKYFQIAPNIMTFYQSSGRKMGYIVVQVQIVTRGDDNLELLETHLPLMQDALIDFFNRQEKKVVQDLTQRESLRQQATEKIAQVIKDEVGYDVVENVLFTQYVFQ